MTDLRKCPNKCGPLNILKKPMAILYLLPEDVLDMCDLEGTHTPENMFGHLLGVCGECGFTLLTTPIVERDYDNGIWVFPDDEEAE